MSEFHKNVKKNPDVIFFLSFSFIFFCPFHNANVRGRTLISLIKMDLWEAPDTNASRSIGDLIKRQLRARRQQRLCRQREQRPPPLHVEPRIQDDGGYDVGTSPMHVSEAVRLNLKAMWRETKNAATNLRSRVSDAGSVENEGSEPSLPILNARRESNRLMHNSRNRPRRIRKRSRQRGMFPCDYSDDGDEQQQQQRQFNLESPRDTQLVPNRDLRTLLKADSYIKQRGIEEPSHRFMEIGPGPTEKWTCSQRHKTASKKRVPNPKELIFSNLSSKRDDKAIDKFMRYGYGGGAAWLPSGMKAVQSNETKEFNVIGEDNRSVTTLDLNGTGFRHYLSPEPSSPENVRDEISGGMNNCIPDIQLRLMELKILLLDASKLLESIITITCEDMSTTPSNPFKQSSICFGRLSFSKSLQLLQSCQHLIMNISNRVNSKS